MTKIPGGYFLKARCVQRSDIAKAPPHVREIWDWFLMNANHKDHKGIKRGQLLCTYKDIREGLCWYVGYRKCQYTKAQCETAMKWLKRTTMVATAKTTVGMIVTILNYDKYQNPKNYENHNVTSTRATTEPQWHDTIYKNEKNVKNEKKQPMVGPSFEDFYEHYPKKRNKAAAVKAWNKLKPDWDLFTKMMSALELQKKTNEWTKDNGQFIPNPATWLNGERWTDEIIKERDCGKGNSRDNHNGFANREYIGTPDSELPEFLR